MSDVFELYAAMSEKQAMMERLKTEGENMGLSIEAAKRKMQKAMATADEMTQQEPFLSAIELSRFERTTPSVGKQTQQPAASPPTDMSALSVKKFCRNCGFKISAAATFCANCGTKLR